MEDCLPSVHMHAYAHSSPRARIAFILSSLVVHAQCPAGYRCLASVAGNGIRIQHIHLKGDLSIVKSPSPPHRHLQVM